MMRHAPAHIPLAVSAVATSSEDGIQPIWSATLRAFRR